jgi:hypothetical protein
MNGRLRATARRVKRWDGGTMILRWVLVGVLEAARASVASRGTRTRMRSLRRSGSMCRRYSGHLDLKRAAA